MTETNSKEITIKQQGDSEWIFNDTKLFEVGETYFLFLKETSQSKAAYWIIGEDTGTLYKTPASHKRDRRFCKYIGYSIASLL
ncbi:hypothetical protein P4631_11140 [Halalkalibacterium halodurans]|uniref:hypothetical protein n=1 Tax=Halalkalibacterium halodurans TaxID=86665 RepID=UPI0005A0B761|nr:hypothetical protein [Halalkalibacterium halodurans]MED4123786.1 hypothetical protein [Halalkalibacterium halodurans]MED4163447.1 hypothetical protein [Halalkalibacterium halodurans]MED4172988.1 hypothetical protein [Halalkalibacterium halodurans]